MVEVPSWNGNFPALTDEGNGFGSITLTTTGSIQGIQFVKADATGYTSSVWNSQIQAQGFAKAYFNTADDKWYKESTFATEILAPVLDDIYYVVGSEGMIGENWSWNTDNGLMAETAEGVQAVTFSRIPDGTYEFKIVQDPKDFGWDNQIVDDALKSNNGNMAVTAANGVNDITITLDVATKAVTATVVKSPINGADVAEMIAALPEVDAITLADEESVAAVEAAYEGLSDDEKANVSNYEVLVALRAKLDELQQAADDAANVILHFENVLAWETVNAYAFDYIGQLLGDWPGEEISANASNEGWYSFKLTSATDFTVIFTGSGNQTANIPIVVGEGITEVWITMTGDLEEPDAFGNALYEIVVSDEAPEGWIDENPSDDPVTPEESGKFYFDNSITQWEEVYVWAWVSNDDLWAINNGFMSWPGLALEIDEATGYYVYECAEVVDGINVMFNNAGKGELINDESIYAACPGMVFVPEGIDEDGRWYGSWEDIPSDDPVEPEEPVTPGESGTFYFDNSVTQWDEVCVWCWVTGDDMWSLDNGFEAWPGIALERDAVTGYYIYECAEVVDGINVMFHNAGQGEQINDESANAASVGKVFVPEGIDEGGKWYGSWEDVIEKDDEVIDIADDSEVILDKAEYTYDGTTKTPTVTVKVAGNTLVEGVDYAIAYNENVNAGTATVTITGMGKYVGEVTKTFEIKAAQITEVTLDKTEYTYDGKAKNPTVTVKANGKVLVADTDYTTEYRNNKNVGIATVRVTGKGNYTRIIEKDYKINPSAIKNFTYSARSSSAVALKWTKNVNATGYVIEQYKSGKWVEIKKITKNTTTSYKVTDLSASTANKFRIKAYCKAVGNNMLYSSYTTKTVNTLPSGVKNFTYSARSSSAVVLKWTKNTSATGYVIEQYKSGKWVKIKTITKNSTVSYKVTGLKASTANKFRIKAYKSYGKTNLYSGYVTKSVNTLPAGVKNFTYSARTKNTITLKWAKNTSATGYVVEQYKNGKWVKVKTITKNSTVSYKVSGLKKATSYKFRIKAYKSYGKTKLYSGYVTKTIKTK